MHPSHPCAAAEAWLAGFETTQVASCRSYLCTVYRLEPADADAVINTARWQVYRYWTSIENPLGYFWQTLRRAACAYRRQLMREQHQQQAYTTWWQWHQQQSAYITQQVGDALEGTSPRERQLLQWFTLGYDDTQVASWLQTSPAAIRVRRHAAYRTLRARMAPASSTRQQAKGYAAGPVRTASLQ